MDLSDDAKRQIVAQLAHLRANYGEVLAEPDLVEPTADFFPDGFSLDPEGVATLARRMMSYAPLRADLPFGLAFVEPEGGGGGGGCGSGACGPGGAAGSAIGPSALESDEGYAVVVHVKDAGDPVLLTTSLARSVGRLVLFEAGEDVAPPLDPILAELTAVASGLGLLLLNGSSVYTKGCGGLRQHRATALSTPELAFALALFVRVTGAKPRTVQKHLAATQSEAWVDALAWVDAQPALVDKLRHSPELLADGIFEFDAPRGFFQRLFGRKEPAPTAAPRPTAKPKTEEELRRLAEAKALVDDAF